MSKQTRLCFLPSGELTYSLKDPLPDYPLLNPAPFWPKFCPNDNLILNAPKLNSVSPLLRLPDEVLQPILQDAIRTPLDISLERKAYWSFYHDDIDDPPLFGPARGWIRYAATYRLIWVCKRFHTLYCLSCIKVCHWILRPNCFLVHPRNSSFSMYSCDVPSSKIMSSTWR
jgi:hypothetical protein